MKKKNIIIISVTLLIAVIIFLIVMFINNINKDKKIQEENIITINESYNNFAEEVKNYNSIRNEISTFINNFYYDTIEEKYIDNLKTLNNYDNIVNRITKEIKILDSKCNTIYKDKNINTICSNYKNEYEIIVNVFINDIKNYNNKLNSYNRDNNKNIDTFKSNYINDYIDYNNDKVFAKKDEVNE